jgi:ABC-type lipoprotein export system ATPase subunit
VHIGVVANTIEQLTNLMPENTVGDNVHLFMLAKQVDSKYGAQDFS